MKNIHIVLFFTIIIFLIFFYHIIQQLIRISSLKYDEELAKRYANYAGITHCSDDQINAWNCTKCKKFPLISNTKVFYNEEFDIKGFTAYDPDRNVI